MYCRFMSLSGLGRRAEPFFTIRYVIHHPGPRGDDGLISDFQVSGNSHLPREHNIIPQLRAAGNAGLRDQQAALADFDVVRDLHEVINLRALADDGGAECAAVDRHARADFHVVADDDVANLRHLAVDAAVLHVAETIRADHRVGVNADAPADFRARINHNVREQIHVVAEFGVVADEIAALQNGPRADAHAFADNTVRTDVRGGINLRARRDDSRGMNAGGESPFRKKKRHHFGEGDARVRPRESRFFSTR